MPQDALLSVSKVLPAAAANNDTNGIDLQAVAPNSNAWRLGSIRVSVPALANHTDSSKIILLTMYVAPPLLTGTTFPVAAGTYAEAVPSIVVKIAGVASTGSLATVVDVPLPPGFTGFVRFNQLVPSGDGDNTGSSVTYTWNLYP